MGKLPKDSSAVLSGKQTAVVPNVLALKDALSVEAAYSIALFKFSGMAAEAPASAVADPTGNCWAAT